jgi:LCP family protein required for cell wall assembly
MSKKIHKNRPQMDGVIRRPNRTPIGAFNDKKAGKNQKTRRRLDDLNDKHPASQGLHESLEVKDDIRKTANPINMDLNGDSEHETEAKVKKGRLSFLKFWKRKKEKKPWTVGRIIKRGLLFSFLAVFLVGGYFGLKLFLAAGNIIDRAGDGAPALRANVDPSQLNGEGDGRVNVMLLGIGGDSHVAGDLADSIIIVSIDPFNNEAAMLSIPRDLYVDIPGFGSSRINAAHSYGVTSNYPGGGIALMEETLEKVLDIPIHYYIRVDFEGFVQAVDAVGGITINLEDPLYDTNFWWQYGILNLPAGENYLDGEKALYVARSRLTSPRGDFDRGDRQRKILIAIKDKALSLGTFANPIQLSRLIDAAGNHVKTNLQISEMLRLHEIASQVNFNKMRSEGLHNGPESYLASQNVNGASVQVPRSGDFTEIQEYVRQLFPDGFIKKEAANIDIYNGSGIKSYGKDLAEKLRSYGYKIQTVKALNNTEAGATTIIDLSNGEKPVTKRYLEQRFGVKASASSNLPEEITTTADFVIILGTDYGQY